MEIKKLMFVTKFEDLSFDALRSLMNLKDASLTHVVFVNVIERERVAMHRGTGFQKDEAVRLRETANIRFIDWAENLFEQGMECGVYIVVGSPVPQIIKATEKEDADLIVIGRSHKGLLDYLYAGSHITELLRRSTKPVLVYKHLPDKVVPVERPFDRPLVATDWSPASLKAVEYLKDLKNVIQEVHIIHVAGEKELDTSSPMGVQHTRKTHRRKLQELCDALEEKGIKARPHVYIGDPDTEIEKAATECLASMIVLGSSGKAAWVERWLGSTPLNIAEKSIYPTLLIPPDKN